MVHHHIQGLHADPYIITSPSLPPAQLSSNADQSRWHLYPCTHIYPPFFPMHWRKKDKDQLERITVWAERRHAMGENLFCRPRFQSCAARTTGKSKAPCLWSKLSLIISSSTATVWLWRSTNKDKVGGKKGKQQCGVLRRRLIRLLEILLDRILCQMVLKKIFYFHFSRNGIYNFVLGVKASKI
jgi:hypothetical protein